MKSLFGDEYNIEEESLRQIKQVVNKTKALNNAETSAEKILSSKKVSLADKLVLIKDRVLKVLGKQVNNTIVIRDLNTFSAYIDKAIKVGRIAIDTETNNSTDPITCKIVGLCLYVPGEKHAYIPINHTDFQNNRLAWQITEDDCKAQLQRILDNKVFIVMHNGKFDYEVIRCTCHINVLPDWDTIIAAHSIDENEFSDKKTSLKYIYTKYIDPSQEKYDIESLFKNIPYQYVDPEVFALYAASDAFMTDEVYLWEKPQLDGEKFEKLMWNIINVEFPQVEVAAEMELNGICIDQAYAERLRTKYNNQLNDIDNQIIEELNAEKDLIANWKLTKEACDKTVVYPAAKTKMSFDKILEQFPYIDTDGKHFKYGKSKLEQLEDPINLASPSQLAILFYDVLKCPAVNKKKPRATGKDELKALAQALARFKAIDDELFEEDDVDEEDSSGLDFDIVETVEYSSEAELNTARAHAANLCSLILKRRGIVKLITTYIDTIPELAKHWPDGRIRFKLNSIGTDTGRYSSGGKWHFLDENNNSVVMTGINVQNIPSHNPEIRMLFTAKPGYRLIGADYSAQEPRLTAFISQDPNMIQAYMEKKDLYAMIAQSAFDNKYEDNLEFYPAGTEIELDGKKVISGSGKDIEIESDGDDNLIVPNYGILSTPNGDVAVTDLKPGDLIQSDIGLLSIRTINKQANNFVLNVMLN